LLVIENEKVIGLISLQDLQRGLSAAEGRTEDLSLGACRRGDLLWLPESAQLDRLEDQLVPGGLRQIPVFAVEESIGGYLPHGLPNGGLPLSALQGVASRDGLAWALARQLQQRPFEKSATKASATGSD